MPDQNQTQPENPNSPLILIVEDDPSLSKMYALKFKTEGFRVAVANDGAKGLQMAASQNPNIILLDMMLPKYSGIEFLEQFQQHSQGAHPPILALSNLTEKQEMDRAIKLGVKEYLAKAMNTPEDVVAKVKQYLAGGQGQSKPPAQPQQAPTPSVLTPPAQTPKTEETQS